MSRLRAPRSAAFGALVTLSGVPLSCGNVDNATPPATGGTAGTAGGALSSGGSGVGAGSGGGDASGSGGSGVSGASGSAGSAGATGSGGSAGSGGIADGGGSSGCRGLPLDDGGSVGGSTGTCAGSAHPVARSGVDLLLVFDRSISMGAQVAGGRTRWEALQAALAQLAQTPDAAELRAGALFFSISGAGNDNVDCNAGSYATPPVGIGPLADVGDDIVAAMAARVPGGLTPLVPATEGSITYARQWAQSHPDHATAIALVTDSYPTQCSSDPGAVAVLAQTAHAGTPSIRTFVIGVGSNTGARFNLENFARSGGTQTPFVIDDGNITQGFVDAAIEIASSSLACDFAIPPPPAGQIVNPDRVQVVYTPTSTAQPEEAPRLSSSAACGQAMNGGWYFDNPTSPRRIYLCPCTCSRLGAGRVELRFRCRPPLP